MKLATLPESVDPRKVNHVAFVVDASSSMQNLTKQVREVADNLVAHLGKMASDFDQETRVSIYTFADYAKVVMVDADISDIRPARNWYTPNGNTALIDASLKAINDFLSLKWMDGRDHAYLVYIITDGYENASRSTKYELKRRIAGLGDRWTMAILVPDQSSFRTAIDLGFPEGNVKVWEATEEGVYETQAAVMDSTQSYFAARDSGATYSTNLFTPNVANLTAKNVKSLVEMSPSEYSILYVPMSEDGKSIKDFVVSRTGRAYKAGVAFYPLTKAEEIQGYKDIIVVEKGTGKAYRGSNARILLSMPNYDVKVAPASHPKYDIYVQSTSVNRKLVGGTHLLVLT